MARCARRRIKTHCNAGGRFDCVCWCVWASANKLKICPTRTAALITNVSKQTSLFPFYLVVSPVEIWILVSVTLHKSAYSYSSALFCFCLQLSKVSWLFSVYDVDRFLNVRINCDAESPVDFWGTFCFHWVAHNMCCRFWFVSSSLLTCRFLDVYSWFFFNL